MRVSSTEKPMPSSEEMISAITLLRSLTVWPSFVESSCISENSPSKSSCDSVPSVDSMREFIAACRNSMSKERFSTIATIFRKRYFGSMT